MDTLQCTCPYCGTILSMDPADPFVRCGQCRNLLAMVGEAAGAKRTDTVTLTIEFVEDDYLLAPDMHVVIEGREYSIPNHRKLWIEMVPGEYTLLFKSTIRDRRYQISMDDHRTLKVGWKRIWGTVAVKDVSACAGGL